MATVIGLTELLALATPTARQAATEVGLGAQCRNPFRSIVVPLIRSSTIIPPTAQNHDAIENDLRRFGIGELRPR